jgi:ABC-type transporter lipoprotein component MlaA
MLGKGSASEPSHKSCVLRGFHLETQRQMPNGRDFVIDVTTHSLYSDLDREAPEVVKLKHSKLQKFLQYLTKTASHSYTEIREIYREHRRLERLLCFNC